MVYALQGYRREPRLHEKEEDKYFSLSAKNVELHTVHAQVVLDKMGHYFLDIQYNFQSTS